MTTAVQMTTILMTEAEIRSASVCTDRSGEFLPLQRPREPNPSLRHRAGQARVLMYLCCKRVLQVLFRPSSCFVVFCFSALEHVNIQSTAPRLPATLACDGHGDHSVPLLTRTKQKDALKPISCSDINIYLSNVTMSSPACSKADGSQLSKKSRSKNSNFPSLISMVEFAGCGIDGIDRVLHIIWGMPGTV